MEKEDVRKFLNSLPPKNDTWIGLGTDTFGFSHHSSHNREVDSSGASAKPFIEDTAQQIMMDGHNDERFCVPETRYRRLRSIIEKSKGGSILVTGYRGTGKSSLVNYTISEIIRKHEEEGHLDPRGQSLYVPIRINLSTSRDPMALVMMMIKELAEFSRGGRFDGKEAERIEHTYNRFVKIEKDMQTQGHEVSPTFSASFPMGLFGMSVTEKLSEVNTVSYEYRGYTLHEAQQDLILCIRKLYERDYKLIFIFDEIDKLVPDSPEDTPSHKIASTKLKEIKTIVSSLKFLLSEANAFHIFIAGKIVDDSWQEDQNKGEGIFESIFVQNIYVPSTLTSWLKAPPLYPKKSDSEERANDEENANNDEQYDKNNGLSTVSLYKHALAAVGIYPGHWTYNTGLLVLPHFSINELYRLVLRCKDSYVSQNITTHDDENIDTLIKKLKEVVEKNDKDINKDRNKDKNNHVGKNDQKTYDQTHSPCTEKHARRIRYFLRYLTYRGRGIPRKILREFYGMIRYRDDYEKVDEYWKKRGNVEYIVHLKSDLRKKLKFFADIVMVLESRRDFFEQLDDKACVAVFHFIDYIFKFYNKGFSWKDIENANFMTHREELYPSRRLMEYILNLFEDRFIMRVDPRKHEYQFLPRVRNDLEYLFMTFGDEQMELRFTQIDVSHEIQLLRDTISKVEQLPVNDRLETITVQYRLGYLYELLENHETAKLEYEKALRWVQVFMEDNQISQLNHPAVSHIQVVRLNQIVSVAVDIIGRLACIHQQDYELEEAYQCYQIALGYIEVANTYSMYSQQEITYDVFRGRSQFSPILGVVEPLKKSLHPERSFKGDLQAIVELMLPGDEKYKLGYLLTAINGEASSPSEKNVGFQTSKTDPLKNQLESIRAMDILRGISFVTEKLWHRMTSNWYLLTGLDYAIRKNDDVAILRQLVFIAQIMVRRRDFELALMFYFHALEQLYSHANYKLKNPSFSSLFKGQIYESIGDVFVAFSNADENLKKSPDKSKQSPAKKNFPQEKLERLRKIYENLEFEEKRQTEVLPKLNEPEAWYGLAAEQYKIGGQKRYRFDVLAKRLRCRIWNLQEFPWASKDTDWEKVSLHQQIQPDKAAEIVAKVLEYKLYEKVNSVYNNDKLDNRSIFEWNIRIDDFVNNALQQWVLREGALIKAQLESTVDRDNTVPSLDDIALEFVRQEFQTAASHEIDLIAQNEAEEIVEKISRCEVDDQSDRILKSIDKIIPAEVMSTAIKPQQIIALFHSQEFAEHRKDVITTIIKESLLKSFNFNYKKKYFPKIYTIIQGSVSAFKTQPKMIIEIVKCILNESRNIRQKKYPATTSCISIHKSEIDTFLFTFLGGEGPLSSDLKKYFARVLIAEQIEEFWFDSRECAAIVTSPRDVPHFVDMKISGRRRLAELLCLWGKFYAVLAERKLFEQFVSSRFFFRDYLKQVMNLVFETEFDNHSIYNGVRYTEKDLARNRQHPLWQYERSLAPPLGNEVDFEKALGVPCKDAPNYAEMLYRISNEYFLETIEDPQSIEASTCLGELYLFMLHNLDRDKAHQDSIGKLWIASYRYFNQALKTLLGKKQQTRRNSLRILHICRNFRQLFEDPVYNEFRQWADNTPLTALESKFGEHRLSLKKDFLERLLAKMENQHKEAKRQNFRVPISFHPIQFNVLDRETHYDVCVTARQNSDLAKD